MSGGRIFIFLYFLLGFVVNGQGQAAFEAFTDARQVGVGDIFEVRFELKNAQGTGFSPPNMNDFTVVSGPNRKNSMTIVNGQASSSEAITYTLQAQKEGTFSIAAATVSVKGNTLRTTPLSILVTKGKRQTSGGSLNDAKKGVFVRAEASTTTGYLGQQIILDYKLYTRVDVNGMNLVREPKYEGFYYLEVNDYPHEESRVTIGGKAYVSRILRRVALFPQREGITTVEPMTVQVGIIKEKEADPFFDPFFGSFKSENALVPSDAISFNIKPLPQPVPPQFAGAVGYFNAETTLEKNEGTTDDAFSLRVKVTGNGDAKRWLAPKLAPVEGLEFYDPKTVREENIEQQGEWQTVKEFEYLIIPKKAGNYTFVPTFLYLNTEGGRAEYKNLIEQTFTLTIAEGKGTNAPTLSARQQDILPQRTATDFISEKIWFGKTPLFWVLLLLPLIALSGVVVYKNVLIWRSKQDKDVLRSQNASKMVEGRLRAAAGLMAQGDTRSFYDEISRSLTRYVCDKLNLPMAEFSKTTVTEKLQALNVGEINREKLFKILQTCEMALFSGQNTVDAKAPMQAVYEETENIISAIERDLKSTAS